MALKKHPKRCVQGHLYYKLSDCPVCPVCERERKPSDGFLFTLAAPARRALENAGITSLRQLALYTETEVLALHGMGPGSMSKLRQALAAHGLQFKS